MSSDPRPPDTDTVLGKVVAVLSAFHADDHDLRLAELVRRTGLAKGTLHRVLSDLVATRLVERTEHGYRLGGRLFELGMRASVERRLLEVATPFMEDLYERTHETVHLGVLEGREVVYVSKIGGHRQASSPSRIGGRMPLHCTAIGKALLAHSDPALVDEVLAGRLDRRTPRTVTGPGLLRRQLERVLEAGVAYEHEESAVGIVCVAAPVLDADDRPIAAVSLTGPVTRFHPETHATSVRAAAAGVAATLARREALRHDAP
ncbi:IclR family transcriptional regulator [Nocardioides sp. cx-173]|uniref:IclR family transcriptional regulator n=1 Tax=Nocardioides sp. cx-173 TaxID=2898796 RepID=UPI001E4DC758|nr:IclR family transcriptional regulator [Nocardioides sp. cx-173]MCD4527266.1 IclR family transcriptional regulator [Nocardioides sp. cx-173]UGB40357.1 IclR family transcriptional regulator [Nocardioides sp. cx-173]